MPSNKSKKKIWVVTALVVLVVAIMSYFTYSVMRSKLNTNLAKETAKPLEASLRDEGGVKFYENGDSGRGSDNLTPWYQVFYELPVPQSQAVETATKLAESNGFNLKQATPENPGPISVASDFLDKWYYDYSSVSTNYSDLKPGNVQLAFIVDGPGSTYSSGRSIPAGHSIVGIEVRLPEFKR